MFQEIAVDGLALGRIAPRKQLELWPGYRSDVLVQIPANAAGAVYILHDYRPFTPPQDGPPKPDRKHLAVIIVEGETVTSTMPDAAAMQPFRPQSIAASEVTGRQFAAYGIVFRNGRPVFTVDRRSFGDDEARQLWLGEVHEWSLTSRNSKTAPISVSHPFHIHVNPVEIFSITDPQGNEQLDIDPVTKLPIPLWRDTVILHEGWKVLARTRYTDFTGTFVQHCHILDHEDQGMMELIQINARPPDKTAMAPEQPLRPWRARDMALPDRQGREQKLASLQDGRRTLLVFFEGFGCLRCNEQIQQLIARHAEFTAAGIQIIGISTDTVEGLDSALKDLPCPFPILADPDHRAFLAYGSAMGAAPMHGLYLVDAQGLIRWQTVTAAPWLDWDSVFSQASRLLSAIPAQTTAQR
jgi:peroxiredoxin